MGIADVVAKAVFGVLVWAIAAGKSAEEQERRLLGRFRDQRLVGPRAIFKVQPAKCTAAALARGRGLARNVRPTNLIGAALASPIFQELYSIVLVGPRSIFKVQPAKCTEAALALGRGLARKVRSTNLIGAALASSHLSGIVSASAN